MLQDYAWGSKKPIKLEESTLEPVYTAHLNHIRAMDTWDKPVIFQMLYRRAR